MGRQVSDIKAIGTVGDTISYRGYDDKILIRKKPLKVKYPHTKKQVANNNAFSFASTLVSYLDPVLSEVNMANGERPKRRGKKVSLIQKCFAQLPEGQHLPVDLPIVDAPTVDLHFKELTLTRTGSTLTLHAAIDPRLARRLFRCAATILIFNPRKNMYYNASSWQPSIADLTLSIPASWQKDDLQAVGYIILAFKKKTVAALPISLSPGTTSLTDLQHIEWSQLHTAKLLPTN